MRYEIIAVFWLVFLSCVSGLAAAWLRMRFVLRGWLAVYLAILLVAVSGFLREEPGTIVAALAMWLVLALLPALISRICVRYCTQQNYEAARRLAQVIRWLHPADGFWEMPAILHAFAMAQHGELTAAAAALQRFSDIDAPIGAIAITTL